MSRVGKKPVAIPSGGTASVEGQVVKVKGPNGELTRTFHSALSIGHENGKVTVSRPDDEPLHLGGRNGR